MLCNSTWLEDIDRNDFAASVVAIFRPVPLKQLDIGLLPIVLIDGETSQLAELEEFCRKRAIDFSWLPCTDEYPEYTGLGARGDGASDYYSD